MALINCPECNNEISDKAEFCPKCGYKLPEKEPLFQGAYCPKCLDVGFKREGQKCPLCQVYFKDSIYGTFDEVYDYAKNHPELKESPEFSIEAYNKRINYVPVEYGNSGSSNNGVKCHYCGSTNTKKISNISKASSVAMFGIFSKKVHKEWHCNNCNSDF